MGPVNSTSCVFFYSSLLVQQDGWVVVAGCLVSNTAASPPSHLRRGTPPWRDTVAQECLSTGGSEGQIPSLISLVGRAVLANSARVGRGRQ